MTSQVFCYHCVEYIKLDTLPNGTFRDQRSNNNKVMMGGPHAPIAGRSKKAYVK